MPKYRHPDGSVEVTVAGSVRDRELKGQPTDTDPLTIVGMAGGVYINHEYVPGDPADRCAFDGCDEPEDDHLPTEG